MRALGVAEFRVGLERIREPVAVAKRSGRGVRVLGTWQPVPPAPGQLDPFTLAALDVLGEVRPVLVRAVRVLYGRDELAPVELAAAVGHRASSAYALTRDLAAGGWIDRERDPTDRRGRRTLLRLAPATRAAIAARIEERPNGAW